VKKSKVELVKNLIPFLLGEKRKLGYVLVKIQYSSLG
jgi:hypothetical protein